MIEYGNNNVDNDKRLIIKGLEEDRSRYTIKIYDKLKDTTYKIKVEGIDFKEDPFIKKTINYLFPISTILDAYDLIINKGELKKNEKLIESKLNEYFSKILDNNSIENSFYYEGKDLSEILILLKKNGLEDKEILKFRKNLEDYISEYNRIENNKEALSRGKKAVVASLIAGYLGFNALIYLSESHRYLDVYSNNKTVKVEATFDTNIVSNEKESKNYLKGLIEDTVKTSLFSLYPFFDVLNYYTKNPLEYKLEKLVFEEDCGVYKSKIKFNLKKSLTSFKKEDFKNGEFEKYIYKIYNEKIKNYICDFTF